jgi:hypothetical protein
VADRIDVTYRVYPLSGQQVSNESVIGDFLAIQPVTHSCCKITRSRGVLLHRLCLFLLATAVMAQNPKGAVSGHITDPDGNPVINTALQLKRTADGQRFQTASSPRGDYSFTGLPAGTYDLLIPETGFTYAKFERKNIVVATAGTVQLDLRIDWGGNLGTIGDDDTTILRNNRKPAPAGPTPRMPDGKPDLSGVWNGQKPLNPEDPAVLPWAQAISKARLPKDDPSAQCLPSDILVDSPNQYEIVQTPRQVLILVEYNVGALRQIFLDGRSHPRDVNPSWMGHSIGHWDGDTLVVDTAGFNDRSWLENNPHTEMLHVITRYRRPDFGHMDVDITVEDPATFTRPWRIHTIWELIPGEEFQEYVCENNRDPQHMVGK